MKTILFTFIILLNTVTFATSEEYGYYDLKKLLAFSETASDKKRNFDLDYYDKIVNDLSAHAKNYPPKFDNPQDQNCAIKDIQSLSEVLDILINVPNPNHELLIRAGYLNSIGHNLDIIGSAEKIQVEN